MKKLRNILLVLFTIFTLSGCVSAHVNSSGHVGVGVGGKVF
ncbi:lipoprotein [Aliarcobacter vitoriensis]|nr:hypothetical protein [Aliarcobacter vitoriensis]